MHTESTTSCLANQFFGYFRNICCVALLKLVMNMPIFSLVKDKTDIHFLSSKMSYLPHLISFWNFTVSNHIVLSRAFFQFSYIFTWEIELIISCAELVRLHFFHFLHLLNFPDVETPPCHYFTLNSSLIVLTEPQQVLGRCVWRASL